MQKLSETHLTANGVTVQTAGDQSDDRRNGFSFIQLMNMNVGFLGIQFGWGLQMANMSAIFEYLGANAHSIPILWIAAPVTGLIVQPIIGNLSDLTWTRLGRRRPYFLVGAVLAAIAIIIMPSVSTLWMAVLLLWILDTSNNVSMEPFRAFVGDLLPEHQRTQGFAVQSLMIGLGLVSASLLPWILSHVFKVPESSGGPHSVPLAVGIAFYTGAIVYLGTILSMDGFHDGGTSPRRFGKIGTAAGGT
ncbi:MAG: MFS transporter [Leptolyngbyaceae bacterium]|nr:MFS transporter [Leptolyngbyaceae bacterium]